MSGRVHKTHMEISWETKLTAQGVSSDVPSGFGDLQARAGRTRAPDSRRTISSASITVTYRQEPRLDLLVPSEMLETYEAPTRSRFTGNETMSKVNCRATYSDFKRFGTSGRLIIQK